MGGLAFPRPDGDVLEVFFFNFLKRDPQLLARRLEREETDPAQKLFQKIFIVILLPGFVLIGLDFRFGWSRSMSAVSPVLICHAVYEILA